MKTMNPLGDVEATSPQLEALNADPEVALAIQRLETEAPTHEPLDEDAETTTGTGEQASRLPSKSSASVVPAIRPLFSELRHWIGSQ
jgi:hypothetical protein